MILPGSVDAQVSARIAFALESGSFQQPDRSGVVGNTRRFDAMQPQRAEAVRNQGTHCSGHIAFTYEWCADPISDTAGLSDAPPNVRQRQSSDHRIVVAAEDQKRVRQIAALVFGISFEPASKGTACEIVGRPSRLPWSEEITACLTQSGPLAKVAAVRSAQRDARAGNAGHRFV